MDAPTNVLVVEDAPALSALVGVLLHEAGYRAVTITDHAQIASAVDRWRPRCVILDGEVLSTGESRSWDDAVAIRRAHPDLPVVMFTADNQALDEARAGTSERSRAAGFVGIVGKPFVIEEFLMTVKSAMASPVPAEQDAPPRPQFPNAEEFKVFPDVGQELLADWPATDLFGTIVHELRAPHRSSTTCWTTRQSTARRARQSRFRSPSWGSRRTFTSRTTGWACRLANATGSSRRSTGRRGPLAWRVPGLVSTSVSNSQSGTAAGSGWRRAQAPAACSPSLSHSRDEVRGDGLATQPDRGAGSIWPGTARGRDDGAVMHSGHAGVSLLTLPRNRIRPGPRVAPLRVGDLAIDALRQNIRQGSREIRLSPGEHILLYTVAARAGEVVSYREVADALGPTGGEVRNNTIARHL